MALPVTTRLAPALLLIKSVDFKIKLFALLPLANVVLSSSSIFTSPLRQSNVKVPNCILSSGDT